MWRLLKNQIRQKMIFFLFYIQNANWTVTKYINVFCYFITCHFLEASNENRLHTQVTGKRLVVCRQSTQLSQQNYILQESWRENWMGERWNIITLNWRTLLLMRRNFRCFVIFSVAFLTLLWHFDILRTSAALAVRRLFEALIRVNTVGKVIAMFRVISPIVINKCQPVVYWLLKQWLSAFFRWLAKLNIKGNLTSMFVNRKRR